MNDVENSNTIRVLQFIEQNPGSHLRQIKKELKISMGTVQYHLQLLEREGKIVSEKQNLFRHYFPVGLFEHNEKTILKILKQETARELLMLIIERSNPTQTDLVNRLEISAASVSLNLGKLIELGLISEIRDGKFKRYVLLEDPKIIVHLMKNYQVGIWNRWSNTLSEMFISMAREDEK
ncbi:MAG: winged helix-turn-helix transcriptional regulator [Nitrosarchaeum sp.]